MGMPTCGFSIASYDDPRNGTPDPERYKILRSVRVRDFLIIEIRYLDCTNYEGKKVLVFKNCSLGDLKNQKIIDPHFSDKKNIHSPIARFEPTLRGMGYAMAFINSQK